MRKGVRANLERLLSGAFAESIRHLLAIGTKVGLAAAARVRVRPASPARRDPGRRCALLPARGEEPPHPPAPQPFVLKGARKSFAWQDYRAPLIRAHIQLGGPIVVVWDTSTPTWPPG
ncbi:hypothetical protein ABZ119_28850 [Streptomyces sp. NPDC006288]|uniref:hypothetical protein n=1 Tax=Streptomyces sp. NPDC006288 TaxID=3156743 RepID=UPI0033A6B2C3